jgi:HEAT repeat protein
MSTTPAPVKSLLDGLRSADEAVRAESARALGTCGDGVTAGPALVQMLDDTSELVRADAIEALFQLDFKEAIPAVSRLLQADESALVRACAAETLGDMGDGAVVAVLGSALGDEDGAVRAYAANAVGLLGSTEHLPLLDARLAIEQVASVRVELHAARARLGAPGALAEIVAVLETMDEDLGINVLNACEDLARRRHPPDLDAERPALARALSDVADRFPLSRRQAQSIIEQLMSVAHGGR